MTLKEMFEMKYQELQSMYNPVWWSNAEYYANAKKMSLEQYCYMSLSITEKDIKENGGYNGELYNEIKTAHENKLLASNKHCQYYRMITQYWLTKKGYKAIIC